MDMTTKSCRDFVDALASSDPIPGGGGAAALVGAIGTALGNMVGSLTIGKKKPSPHEAEILEIKAQCDALQKALLEQVEADGEGFMPLYRAYGIPKDDPDREKILDQASYNACIVPMRIMELSGQGINCARILAEKGNSLAISDAGCGAILCKAAMQAASLSVFINTKSIKDRELAAGLNIRANALLDKYCPMANYVFNSVKATLEH